MPLRPGGSRATDLAYAAGILDGEGSIGARRVRHLRASFGLHVSVIMCDQEVPEFMHSLFGGKLRVEKRRTTTGKLIYGWYIHCAKATSALQLMLPYLRIKKRRAADLILLQSMMRKRGGSGVTKHIPDDEISARLEIVARIKAANFAGNARIRRHAP